MSRSPGRLQLAQVDITGNWPPHPPRPPRAQFHRPRGGAGRTAVVGVFYLPGRALGPYRGAAENQLGVTAHLALLNAKYNCPIFGRTTPVEIDANALTKRMRITRTCKQRGS